MANSEHVATRVNFIDDETLRPEAVRDLLDRLRATSVSTTMALAEFVADSDEFQQKVVDSSESTIRMLAPAGSGKTQTIINRALSRVRDGIRPSRILILTFDNSAATALRDKLGEQLARLDIGGDTNLADLRISTLNAYGYRLLRDSFPEDYKQLVDASRSNRFARDGLSGLRNLSAERHRLLPANLRSNVYLDLFGLLKNELFDPRGFDSSQIANFVLASTQAQPFFGDASTPAEVKSVVQALVWLFQTYDVKLQEFSLMDFDDQKLRAYARLETEPMVAESVRASLDEVVVDEFQDINRLDFELIKLISQDASLTVTGDDDQAIYGFRGCSPDFIIDLDKYLDRSVVSYELQINYRCPPNIVSRADQLIRHNSKRVEKSPISARTDPALIKVVATQSAGVEAQGTVEFIRKVMERQPALDHSDFAVLYRTNAQSLPLQVEFILNDIPYSVRKQDNIVSNQALVRLLALLRVKVAATETREATIDDQVLAISSYFRYMSAPQVESITKVLREVGDFKGALGSAEIVEAVPKTKGNMAGAFDALLAASSLGKTLEIIGDRFRGVRGMIGSLEEAIEQSVPLGEVYELARHFGGNVPEFVSMMESALDRARTSNAGEDEAGVSLLTYFKSKGRQWHTVILTTCNEGLIPHHRSNIEDERRLFYVAMTRASANLMISYVGTSLGKKVAPSRFLNEAGVL